VKPVASQKTIHIMNNGFYRIKYASYVDIGSVVVFGSVLPPFYSPGINEHRLPCFIILWAEVVKGVLFPLQIIEVLFRHLHI